MSMLTKSLNLPRLVDAHGEIQRFPGCLSIYASVMVGSMDLVVVGTEEIFMESTEYRVHS